MSQRREKRKAGRRARKRAERAWDAVEAGDLQLALKEARRAVEERADNPRLWSDYGRILELNGRFQEAIDALRNALILAPKLAEAHAGLAQVFARIERTILAEKHMRRAVELEPSSSVYRELWEEFRARLPPAATPGGVEDGVRADAENESSPDERVLTPPGSRRTPPPG